MKIGFLALSCRKDQDVAQLVKTQLSLPGADFLPATMQVSPWCTMQCWLKAQVSHREQYSMLCGKERLFS